MDYDQQSVEEMPRIMPPLLWMGLSGFFALCCCFFFGVAGVAAFLLTGGYTVVSPSTASASTAKPVSGEVKFYLTQTPAGAASGLVVTSSPTTTTTIYAYFTYKNMPKSGLTWSYLWSLDGNDLPALSKTAQRWAKEGSGTFFVRLNDDKGLKTGDYDLSIQLNDQEVQTASIHVGP